MRKILQSRDFSQSIIFFTCKIFLHNLVCLCFLSTRRAFRRSQKGEEKSHTFHAPCIIEIESAIDPCRLLKQHTHTHTRMHAHARVFMHFPKSRYSTKHVFAKRSRRKSPNHLFTVFRYCYYYHD